MNKHQYNCLFLLLSLVVGYLWHFSWVYYLIISIVFIGLLFWGIFDIRLSYFVSTIYHLKGRPKKVIALSFDDGITELTPRFLDLLKEYEVKAIFFCIGQRIEKYPDTLRRIKKEGHLIGNHTYSHSPKNCFAPTATMVEEIQKTDEILKKFEITTCFFRPPYGVTNPHIARAIKLTGKKAVGWDIRSLDTVIKDETRLLSRVLSKLSHGNIILMHDTSERTLHVLEKLLKYLKENNYKIINRLD
ncbi:MULTISPECIES: polysaccharide deacetylase family protein [unclassified Capnocytophaga]|uniref:polysaccharide deacetylase family protein n=1 Tax=unclassified Capnocytophaga TaxID=2640652 RepID=UPI00058EF759|nr:MULTISPECIES: polysaccharide deacetylase family protein [unclassified Capnocytophaga]MEB3004095.1 polysaccharide deacetylase family protein [Capnocytophaga sp. G2]